MTKSTLIAALLLAAALPAQAVTYTKVDPARIEFEVPAVDQGGPANDLMKDLMTPAAAPGEQSAKPGSKDAGKTAEERAAEEIERLLRGGK